MSYMEYKGQDSPRADLIQELLTLCVEVLSVP